MGSQRNGFKKESFILSVDVGTTSIRCHVYDKEANTRGSCTTKVPLTTLVLWNCAFPHIVHFCVKRAQNRLLLWCASPQVVPLYPEVGHVEMDPEALWNGFTSVVRGAVQGTVRPVWLLHLLPSITHTVAP